MATPSVPDQIQTAIGDTLENDLVELGLWGLGIGAALFVLRKGVKVAYGFIR